MTHCASSGQSHGVRARRLDLCSPLPLQPATLAPLLPVASRARRVGNSQPVSSQLATMPRAASHSARNKQRMARVLHRERSVDLLAPSRTIVSPFVPHAREWFSLIPNTENCHINDYSNPLGVWLVNDQGPSERKARRRLTLRVGHSRPREYALNVSVSGRNLAAAENRSPFSDRLSTHSFPLSLSH